MYNFGILGCGMIAEFHCRAIANIKGAILKGVADVNFARATVFAEKNNCTAYENYEAMLSDDEIDVICICTPSGLHAKDAIEALEHNKHVVLEKPMALNAKSADSIIEACEKSGCMLTVISQIRFSPSVQRVKKLIDEGALGRLLSCDLYMKYWRDTSYYETSPWKGTFVFDGGGALMNQGIHGIDVLQYLVGEAKIVAARSKTQLHNIETEDLAVAIAEFPNGAIGVIEGSTCIHPGFKRKIEIAGTKGFVSLLEDNIEKLYIDGKEIPTEDSSLYTDKTGSDPMAIPEYLHEYQIKNLLKAIEGKEELLVDCHEGKKAVKIICDIYNKSKEE